MEGTKMGTKIIKWRWVLFVIAAIFLTIAVSYAKHVHLEKWYQNRWCSEHGGQAEVALPDGTRADCITEKNAVEFDFGKKWAEAIGQALYYSVQTGKRPGVVLILE